MATNSNHVRTLIDKLDQLPPERVAEVEDFVDFLRHKDQGRSPDAGRNANSGTELQEGVGQSGRCGL